MRASTLLSLVAIGLAVYSLVAVRRLEARLPAKGAPPAGEARGGPAGTLVSEARRRCEKALKLVREGRRREAAAELRRAIEALSKAERSEEAEGERGRLGELVRRAEEALKALKERLERESPRGGRR